VSEPYPRVTALVSVYRGERHIRSCIRDLVGQTLFEKGEMEILVLDACSPESEYEQIVDYCKASPETIKYLQLDRRLNLYETWNVGAEIARGNYLTSANVDDIHKLDCLELLAEKLDQDQDLGLVYGQQLLTSVEVDSYEAADGSLSNDRPLFFAPAALLYNPCGSQPMWRKQLHKSLQGFDEDFRIAGDYDFLLRAAQITKIQRVENAWGVFLDRPDSLSRSGMLGELQRIESKYANAETILRLYAAQGFDVETAENRVQVFEDFIRRCLFYLVVWGGRWSARSSHSLALVAAMALKCESAEKGALWIGLLEEIRSGELVSANRILWRNGFLESVGHPLESFARNTENLSPCPAWIKRLSEAQELSLTDLCWAGCGIDSEQIEKLGIGKKSDRKFYVWGFSETGRKIQKLLKNMKAPVSAFIDQAAQQLAKQYPNQRIIRLEFIDRSTLSDSFFFIATGDKVVVEKQLVALGLVREINYI